VTLLLSSTSLDPTEFTLDSLGLRIRFSTARACANCPRAANHRDYRNEDQANAKRGGGMSAMANIQRQPEHRQSIVDHVGNDDTDGECDLIDGKSLPRMATGRSRNVKRRDEGGYAMALPATSDGDEPGRARREAAPMAPKPKTSAVAISNVRRPGGRQHCRQRLPNQ